MSVPVLVTVGKVIASPVTDWLVAVTPTPTLIVCPVSEPVKAFDEPYEISKIVPEALAELK